MDKELRLALRMSLAESQGIIVLAPGQKPPTRAAAPAAAPESKKSRRGRRADDRPRGTTRAQARAADSPVPSGIDDLLSARRQSQDDGKDGGAGVVVIEDSRVHKGGGTSVDIPSSAANTSSVTSTLVDVTPLVDPSLVGTEAEFDFAARGATSGTGSTGNDLDFFSDMVSSTSLSLSLSLSLSSRTTHTTICW
eukprot:TRINITY_DN1160_c1_g1_i6.p3 TRINITY_DN1160_c1_g1~~TRINITY_DN1160_c1_g1_i6.p3  ORF type:complete len:194 (-),score=51.94 TRINITY_DN1160_c1_g1_i6:335-916(-)